MSLRSARSALVFLLGLPSQLPMQAFAQTNRASRRARAVDPLQKRAHSGYHDCDAKILAALWHSTPYGAKKTVGRKIGWGNRDIVEQELKRARKTVARAAEVSDGSSRR